MRENIIKLLAYLRTLSLYYKTAHWQARGSIFYGDHLLFDRLYKAVDDEIDAVAEIGIKLTNVDVVSLSEHLTKVQEMVEKMPTENSSNIEYVKHASTLEIQFLDFLEEIGDSGSVGFKNLIGGIAENHERNSYLLKQRLTQ